MDARIFALVSFVGFSAAIHLLYACVMRLRVPDVAGTFSAVVFGASVATGFPDLALRLAVSALKIA